MLIPRLRADPQNESALTTAKTARHLHWQRVMVSEANKLNAFAEALNSKAPTLEDIRNSPLKELQTTLEHLVAMQAQAEDITGRLQVVADRVGMSGAGRAALSRLDVVSREIRDRLNKVAVRYDALVNLSSMSELSAYMEGLQAYVARFPGDGRTQKIRDVLAASDDYGIFLDGAYGSTNSPPALGHLVQIFHALPADNRFWKEAYGNYA